MGGIEQVASSFSEESRRRLPGQCKTQRENLALLVATMLDVRSANLMELAMALPQAARNQADRTMRLERASQPENRTGVQPHNPDLWLGGGGTREVRGKSPVPLAPKLARRLVYWQ